MPTSSSACSARCRWTKPGNLHRVVETGVEDEATLPWWWRGSTSARRQDGWMCATMEQYVAAAVAIQYTPSRGGSSLGPRRRRAARPAGPHLVRESPSAMTATPRRWARSGPQGHCLGRPFSLPSTGECQPNFVKKQWVIREIQSLEYSFVQVTFDKMVGMKKDIVINNSCSLHSRAGFLRTGWHIFWQHQVPGMSPPFPA